LKKLAVLLILILICLFSIPAYASAMVPYTVDELNMSIDVPSDWITLTRDMDDNNPYLDEFGLTVDEINAQFENNHIYLNSVYSDETSTVELVVTMLDYVGSNAVYSFDDLSSDELTDIAQDLEGQLHEQTGADYKFLDIYKSEQATFMCFDLQQSFEGMTVYGHQCYTIVNGQAINITMHSYANPISPEVKTIQYEMVDSVKFSSIQKKSAAKTVNLYKSVRTGLITGAVFGVAFLVFSLFSKKARAKRKAKNKPDDFTDMSS